MKYIWKRHICQSAFCPRANEFKASPQCTCPVVFCLGDLEDLDRVADQLIAGADQFEVIKYKYNYQVTRSHPYVCGSKACPRND